MDVNWTELVNKVYALRGKTKDLDRECQDLVNRRRLISSQRKELKIKSTIAIDTIKKLRRKLVEIKLEKEKYKEQITKIRVNTPFSRIFKALTFDTNSLLTDNNSPSKEELLNEAFAKINELNEMSVNAIKGIGSAQDIATELEKQLKELTEELAVTETKIRDKKREVRNLSRQIDTNYLRPKKVLHVFTLADGGIFMKIAVINCVLETQNIEIAISTYIKRKGTDGWEKLRENSSPRTEKGKKSIMLDKMYKKHIENASNN